MNVLGYAAFSATVPLAPYNFERREPRADDVVIDILFCGICHSDLHYLRNHGRFTTYPAVAGHEMVGRVVSVGADAVRYKAGDIVGVGCMVDSCGHCLSCQYGMEQSCHEGPTFSYGAIDRHDGMRTFGGYSQRIVVAENFVLHIPEGMDPAAAAPLLCAGITTWSPLQQWKVGPGSKVGVVGLGGLGHMAIKLAKALGAKVTLFTRSAAKADDARRLGADEVIVTSDPSQMATTAGELELIIDTVPYGHDVNPYLDTLGFDGVLVLVGYFGPLDTAVNARALVWGRKVLTGSFIGGVAATQEVLDFCGMHGITSDIEMIPIQSVDAAFDRMEKGDLQHRFVIDMSSLTSTGENHG